MLRIRTRVSRAACIFVALTFGISACGGSDNGAAKPTLSDGVTTQPTAEVTGGPDDGTTAATEQDGTVVSVTCEDPAADPADASGAVATRIPPGMDLRRVGLSVRPEDSALVVSFEAHTPLPASTTEPGGLFWSIDTLPQQDGADDSYQLRVALDGDTWTVEVANSINGEFTRLEEAPTVEAGVLTVAFPMDALPNLPQSFTWGAITEWGEETLYNDACPGVSAPYIDPNAALTFSLSG